MIASWLFTETAWWIIFIVFCFIIACISFVVSKLVTDYIRERRMNEQAKQASSRVVNGDCGHHDLDVGQEP